MDTRGLGHLVTDVADSTVWRSCTERFGELHTHPMNHARDGDPEILKVRTTADSAHTAGDGLAHRRELRGDPALASALYLTETPRGVG